MAAKHHTIIRYLSSILSDLVGEVDNKCPCLSQIYTHDDDNKCPFLSQIYAHDDDNKSPFLSQIYAHDDDVNAVAFADNSSHILFSGGDDGLCKVIKLD